jgi:hypothetical protein
MTVTLDGKTLNLTSRMALREAVTSVKVEWDDWEAGAYTRKLKVLGKASPGLIALRSISRE